MFKNIPFRLLQPNFLLAIFLLFSLVCLTFSLVFVRVIVPGYMLNNQFKVGYNIATTFASTLCARYAAAEIQKQWIRYINHEISDVKYQLSRNPGIAPRWRAVLGISDIYERFRYVTSTHLTQISFIATGLITTAVISAVTLQDITCSATVPAIRIHSGADNNCTRNVPNTNIERTSPLWEYRTLWNHADGSAYFATTNLGCPSWSGAQFMGAINTDNPKQFAYARNGVAINQTAIGAPEIFYTQFPDPTEPDEGPQGHQILQSNLRSVTQCLPVMSANPVKCIPGGTVVATPDPNNGSTYASHNVHIEAGGCTFDQVSYEDPKSPFGVMVSRLCTSDNNGNKSVGQGTIIIGATNTMSLTLAAAIGDTDYLKANGDNYDQIVTGKISNLSYALSCTVDVFPTIKWRTLNLTLLATNNATDTSYSKHVTGEAGCRNVQGSIPDSAWNLGDGYAGGAVAAVVPTLSEGRYWNGMPNAILNQALNTTDTSSRYSSFDAWQRLIRQGPYGFAESKNALEDVLGLTMGITMSQMTTIDTQLPGSPLADSNHFYSPVDGQATFSCTRVGPGQHYALIFCLPPLIAFIIACYLLYVTPLKKTSFKASRLEDLIGIGLANERELDLAYKLDHAGLDMESPLSINAAEYGRSEWVPGLGPEGQPTRSETPIGWNQGLFPPEDPLKKPAR